MPYLGWHRTNAIETSICRMIGRTVETFRLTECHKVFTIHAIRFSMTKKICSSQNIIIMRHTNVVHIMNHIMLSSTTKLYRSLPTKWTLVMAFCGCLRRLRRNAYCTMWWLVMHSVIWTIRIMYWPHLSQRLCCRIKPMSRLHEIWQRLICWGVWMC